MFDSEAEDDGDQLSEVTVAQRRAAVRRLHSIMRPAPSLERRNEAAARRFRAANAGSDPGGWRSSAMPVPTEDQLASTPAGAELAAMVEALDPTTVSDEALVGLARAAEKLIAWINSQQLQAFAELAQRDLWSADKAALSELSPDESQPRTESERWRMARDEIAAALTISRQSAASRLDLAQALCERLPATLGALHRGDIDLTRARILNEETSNLTVDDARGVEGNLLPRLGVLPASRLRREAAKQSMIIAPKSTKEQHERAFADRRVTFESAPNGMAEVHATVSAETAAALRLALDAAAVAMRDDDPHDGRTMDQRRADALGEMAWRSLDTEHIGGVADGTRLSRQHGQRVRVNLTVPFSTLIGLDDYPGELEGYGPIPAAVARRIAQDHPHATWRRFLTRPEDGALAWVDPLRYRPPADLTEHIVLRDRTCRGPICGHSARYCDLDHTIPYRHSARGPGSDEPGQTVPSNLGALCRGDHTSRGRGWRLAQPTPGTFRWTSPTGREYVIPPEAIGPILQPPDPPDLSSRRVDLIPQDSIPLPQPDPPPAAEPDPRPSDAALDIPPF